MKPHRLSDLLSDLCRRINPAYSPGRQKDEFAHALADAGIRPEHGNRGEELETMVLVSAQELAALRAPAVLPPELSDSEWRRMLVDVAKEVHGPVDVEPEDVSDYDLDFARRMEQRYRDLMSATIRSESARLREELTNEKTQRLGAEAEARIFGQQSARLREERDALRSQLAERRVVDRARILEQEWCFPGSGHPNEFRRNQDDCEGRWEPLTIQFGIDGDAWISTPGGRMLRFRNSHGGSMSPRTHKAIKILAEAIHLDNEERPFLDVLREGRGSQEYLRIKELPSRLRPIPPE